MVKVLWDLVLATGAEEEGILMVETLMVLCKIPVSRSSSQESSEGPAWEREFCGMGIQRNC